MSGVWLRFQWLVTVCGWRFTLVLQGSYILSEPAAYPGRLMPSGHASEGFEDLRGPWLRISGAACLAALYLQRSMNMQGLGRRIRWTRKWAITWKLGLYSDSWATIRDRSRKCRNTRLKFFVCAPDSNRGPDCKVIPNAV